MSMYSQLNFAAWGGGASNWFGSREFDTWGIQYNHSGTFLFAAGEGEIKEYSGSWAFLSTPGVRYRYGVKNNLREHWFVTFRGDRVRQYREEQLWPDKCTIAPTRIYEPEKMLGEFRALRLELERNGSSPAAINLVDRLLFIIADQPRLQTVGRSGYFHALSVLQDAIRSNSLKDWDFCAEARRLGVSYPHFRRLFEQAAGLPPARFIKNCRLNMAAAQLLDTDEQIQAVAEACGFSDFFLFSKQFKSFFGVSPLHYRVRPGALPPPVDAETARQRRRAGRDRGD